MANRLYPIGSRVLVEIDSVLEDPITVKRVSYSGQLAKVTEHTPAGYRVEFDDGFETFAYHHQVKGD